MTQPVPSQQMRTVRPFERSALEGATTATMGAALSVPAAVAPSTPRPAASSAAVSGARQRAVHAERAVRDALALAGGASPPVSADPAVVSKHAGSARYGRGSGDTLFANGVSPGDVVQGKVGDCWLLGSFAAVAATEPEAIRRAIRDNGDGTFTARFFTRGRDGRPTPTHVRIDGDVPQTKGQALYARGQDSREQWPALLEKAWASWRGGYSRLDGGVPNDALYALTGRDSAVVHTKTTDPQAMMSALASGIAARAPMVAASRSTTSLARDGVVPGHAYTVLGVQRANGQDLIELRDTYATYEPRGDGRQDGTFRLSAARFHALFQYVVVGSPPPAAAAPASPPRS